MHNYKYKKIQYQLETKEIRDKRTLAYIYVQQTRWVFLCSCFGFSIVALIAFEGTRKKIVKSDNFALF